MNTRIGIIAMFAVLSSAGTFAATQSGALPVSLTVQSGCSIRSASRSMQDVAVDCIGNTPYRIVPDDDAPAAIDSNGSVTTVTF